MTSKENREQRALRKRNEVTEIIAQAFLEHCPDEDNSWRVRHNLIVLELNLERRLFEYFLEN